MNRRRQKSANSAGKKRNVYETSQYGADGGISAGLIEQLYGTLEYNRVLERENAIWDKAIGREQTEFVKAFVERRLQWMDSYYCGL